MKNIKKVALIILGVLLLNTSYASDIKTDSLNVINNKTIDFSLDNNIQIENGVIDGEIKVLNDVEIISAERDIEDSRKVNLYLGKTKLEENTSYSLLTILGSEGSIDFTTETDFNNLEIFNSDILDEQAIESIVIKDEQTIEVFYKQALESDGFEFKLLSTLDIKEISSKDNKIVVNLLSGLKENSDYIMMLISLNNIDFNDGIYDFNTGDLITESNDELTIEENIIEENIGEEENSDVEKVSLNAANTPDTGAETSVLIFLTFILNSFIIFRKKIFKA